MLDGKHLTVEPITERPAAGPTDQLTADGQLQYSTIFNLISNHMVIFILNLIFFISIILKDFFN